MNLLSEDKVPLENCSLLGCYTASSVNLLTTFGENLSVPSSDFKKGVLTPRMGPISCPEISVRITISGCLITKTNEVLGFFEAEA
jgi:hypothetical protein